MRYTAVLRASALVLLLTAGSTSGARTAEVSPSTPDAEEQDRDRETEGSDTPGAPAEGDADSRLFERVRVVGSPDRAARIPGSVFYLGQERLDRQDYSDAHRLLSVVPGVIVREEEGYGLRPNIGMRGTGTERSSKITTLEDGVLVAPAPYAAPAAYYFPSVGRMEGVEVRKGSGSIQHGPYTTGGVLNFLSSSIPGELGGRATIAGGEDDTLRGHVKVGDGRERWGWLVETYQLDTSGFKHLDGGGETGYDLEDWMGKLRFTSGAGARVFQALELKVGTTDQLGHETYVGLTDDDFEADPFRRYAGSQEDLLSTEHEQVVARWLVRLAPGLDVTTTAYRNDFFRNWRKLESVGGVSVSSVLDDPESFADELAILRGELESDSAGDALTVRNNRRDYYAQGAQVLVGFVPADSRHDLEIGVRWHEDEEDRFQEEDDFLMTAGGEMVLTSAGAPGSHSNRESRAQALALHVQDTIRLGRLTLVPGVRFESIDLVRLDWADADRDTLAGERRHEVDAWIPGAGASWRLSDASSAFLGVHRGFSPPPPGSTTSGPEESVNWELGWRRTAETLATQAVAFYTDYSNLLGVCTVSSGCSSADVGDVFDGGEVQVHGLELSLAEDVGRRVGFDFRMPVELAYTLTSAEFQQSFTSEFEPWGDVRAGDELPYLPAHQASLSVGWVLDRFSAYTNLVWVDAMRTVAGQGPIPDDRSTDAHLLVDLTAGWDLRRGLEAFVQVRNLTDDVYVAARRPAGLRPGIGRTALVGLSIDF